MRYYTKNLKLFKEIFGGAKNFLANNNLRIEKYGEDYCVICDYTYEKDLCIFSTRNEHLKDEIVEYLTGNGYEVIC